LGRYDAIGQLQHAESDMPMTTKPDHCRALKLTTSNYAT